MSAKREWKVDKWLDAGYGFDIVLERRDDGSNAV